MIDIPTEWRLPHVVEACVERLCQKGCRAVWGDIERLERGEVLPEVAGLDPAQREAVLAELKSVMAVYGDRCAVAGAAEAPAAHPSAPSRPESATASGGPGR
jgi:hypothetical protein